MEINFHRNNWEQELISVNSIYGVGLNYARHIEEMNSRAAEEPVIFLKPATALRPGGGSLHYPQITRSLHHEVELVLLLGRPLWQATEAEAAAAILGVAVGLDLTLRDRQADAKAKGRPWAVAKGFAGAAPVSDFRPAAEQDLQNLSLSLQVNGELRQQGHTGDMLWNGAALVQYLSTVFELRRGDLIFTGTPEGVSELQIGDRARAHLKAGESELAALEIQLQA